MCVIYRSNKFLTYNEWLGRFEVLVNKVISISDIPLLITGDININVLNTNRPDVIKYLNILSQFNLHQIINTPTRSTDVTQTLIDHIIVSDTELVKHSGVLPCPSISDRDGPYALLNIRSPRYEPRFKIIRDEKNFDRSHFIKDVANLPFSIIYGIDDPEEKLEIFNEMLLSVINTHAPLKKIRVTRPPAPWMKKDEVVRLKSARNRLRYHAHQVHDQQTWKKFKELKRNLKKKIREVKTSFYKQALSSSKPKEVWKIINSVLHPPPRCIDKSPKDLNEYFSTVAQKTLNKNPVVLDDINKFIDTCICDDSAFRLNPITYADVMTHLKSLRSDCSTGADNIPIRYIKCITEEICSPLTHIINSCIINNIYPKPWKLSRIAPINKIPHPVEVSDYRPISILPALSKVYEKVVLKQLLHYIESNNLYKDTVNGFRKGHSTGTALVKLRDDIKRALASGEVTLIVLVDFSKAFDTIAYDKLISKMHQQGFSKSFLKWTLNYVGCRSQYVNFDAKSSNIETARFGVPQGSILGPILFNLYVNDLADVFNSKSIQYADDTTIYEHCRPKDILQKENRINESLSNLTSWAESNSLSVNSLKTKYMICGSRRLTRIQKLDEHNSNLSHHLGRPSVYQWEIKN